MGQREMAKIAPKGVFARKTSSMRSSELPSQDQRSSNHLSALGARICTARPSKIDQVDNYSHENSIQLDLGLHRKLCEPNFFGIPLVARLKTIAQETRERFDSAIQTAFGIGGITPCSGRGWEFCLDISEILHLLTLASTTRRINI